MFTKTLANHAVEVTFVGSELLAVVRSPLAGVAMVCIASLVAARSPQEQRPRQEDRTCGPGSNHLVRAARTRD